MGKTNRSHPSPRLTIQIVSVRHVSVKLRAVALTCRVTLSPKKLNRLMLIAMATPLHSTVGVLSIWSKPRLRSKNGWAAGGRDGASNGRKGIIRMMLSAPKKPSQPTATNGATEYRAMIFSACTARIRVSVVSYPVPTGPTFNHELRCRTASRAHRRPPGMAETSHEQCQRTSEFREAVSGEASLMDDKGITYKI